MAAAVRAYQFEVSDYFFRLTTEAVRLFSNSVCKHRSLDDVINERAERAKCLADSYEAEDLQAHLKVIPIDGEIELAVTILETSAGSIDCALPELERALGSSVRFAEAISLMLFDLVVERNATELITKLGLKSHEAKAYRPSLKRKGTNVLPFR